MGMGGNENPTFPISRPGISLAVREWERNGNNQWESEGNGNKNLAKSGSGNGIGIELLGVGGNGIEKDMSANLYLVCPKTFPRRCELLSQVRVTTTSVCCH